MPHSAFAAGEMKEPAAESPENPEENVTEEFSGNPVENNAADKIVLPTEGEECGELLIVFEEEIAADEAVQIIEDAESVSLTGDSANISADETMPFVSAVIEEGSDYLTAAEELAENDAVAFVQPNFLYFEADEEEAVLTGEEEDYWIDIGTNDPRDDAGANWHVAALHAPEAWGIQKTNGAVRVAVLDTGADIAHVDLAANIDTEYAYQSVDTEGYDLSSNGKTYRFDPRTAGPLTTSFGTRGDLGTHGTHVCGIIGAVPDNGTGVAGISYNAKLVPVNVFNTATIVETGQTVRVATTKTVTAAYNHLFSLLENDELSDLRVINLSLGGYDTSANDKLLEAAIVRAKEEFGIVTVCAGGNYGMNSGYYVDGQIKYSYPADFEDTVAVCSIDVYNWRTSPARSSSSDFNDRKTISAPGGYIYSTYPLNRYVLQSGTSMAAPGISAVLALVFAADPDLTPEEAIGILCETATDMTGDANDFFDSDARCGEGRDMYTGYGMANAEAAVRMAKGMEQRLIPVENVLLSEEEIEIIPDVPYTLTANVVPWDASDKRVRWLNSDPKIVGIEAGDSGSASNEGYTGGTAALTGQTMGRTVVTVETADGEFSSSSWVRVLFRDVTNRNNAAFPAVYWGADNGIVYGYGKYFDVNNNVTRGQVVQFLWRAAGKPNPAKGAVKFKDVAASHPYYKAILWASQNRIAMGYSDGTFRPDMPCTRGQIVTFLWRYDGQKAAAAGAMTFPDVPASHTYYKSIMWASSYGITTGFTDGTFRPGAYCTRGQCVTFIYRLLS